jgi:trans-2-enoyl-CoA reductase
MTKKEYILKFLEHIDPTIFTLADDIRVLVESGNISDELIDEIVVAFTKAVDNTTDTIEKEKLQKGISFLTALKEQEHQSDINDQKDIDELENLLDNL